MTAVVSSLEDEAIAFFEQHAGDGKKVDALLSQPNRVAWQTVRCSTQSPRPVSDDEYICRQLHHPVYIDRATGELKPTAFDDVFNKGLSVERNPLSPIEQIIARGVARADSFNTQNSKPEKNRELIAIGRLIASGVRQLVIDGEPAIGVFDTALADIPAHADVCTVAQKTKENMRDIRSHLTTIVSTEILQSPGDTS